MLDPEMKAFNDREDEITKRMVELGYGTTDFYVVMNDIRYPMVVLWEDYQWAWWDNENDCPEPFQTEDFD